MDETRMDPDVLLRQITDEGQTHHRGQLKIFFGYAAGVGKTYAMLRAAHAAKGRHVDVVVGYVEPHARPATSALLSGLEQIEPLIIDHKGISVREFDLDAAISRHPQLLIVDELAHTNVDGCRHLKRYQDVEELLGAGIDVYTTVNVQHIESLNDQVASITGVAVHERIPDHVFDQADQVELVDIEPEELIARLHAGKIYQEQQVQRALMNFFDMSNLVALREIALRRCADRISTVSAKGRLGGRGDFYTDEHILVCLSSSPSNQRIIRTAARMARAFQGAFTALFVETSGNEGMGVEDRTRLRSNTRLAEQLGATVETVQGDDVPLQIAEFARISGVSKIVLGRSNARPRHLWSKSTLIDRLIAVAPNLDVYVIPDRDARPYRGRTPGKRTFTFLWSDVLKGLAVLVAATLIGFGFDALGFSEANIITVYILGVLVTAVIASEMVYSLVSSAASVLTFNFFFTSPRFTFNAYGAGYPTTFLIMFIAAFITSALAAKIKRQARQSAETAYRTGLLLETDQLLQKERGREGIVSTVATQLARLLKRDIVFYGAISDGIGEPSVFSAEEEADRDDADALITGKEQAVAAWVFKNNKHAGATTDTLAGAKCLYLAVRANERVFGVMGIAIGDDPLNSFESSATLSILGECALALDNEQVIRERGEAAVIAKNEQLRANLLRSISHDLRTPLTSISGNAWILMESGDGMAEPERHHLYQDVYDDSLWLIALVENLLSVTRIEDGTMGLTLTPELMDEVIDEALHHVSRKSVEHHIVVSPTDGFLLARMDARLIMQVVINIVDNAIKYTSAGSTITIDTRKDHGWVIVQIADDGEGIPDEVKPQVFDMFYTAGNEMGDSHRSLGLGLALCRSIVNAHGGEITVSDTFPHGSTFRFTLPAEEVELHE